ADTVINLELPWNPAVLEQRIARVHRMGQSRPVRVVRLVTRGSIEERVLRTIEVKRSLFAGVFAGESDEVSFEALGQQQFLQSVRELIDAPVEAAPAELPAAPPLEPQLKMLTAAVQFLEALAEVMAQTGSKLPAELSQRTAAAVQRLLRGIESREPPA